MSAAGVGFCAFVHCEMRLFLCAHRCCCCCFWSFAQQGRSCSECAEGHYRDEDTVCKKCNNYVWIIYTIGFFAALILAPMVMNVSKSQGFMSINIFVGTMQV